MILNWIPLPHCPDKQLEPIGDSLENAGWDIRAAEDYLALSYKDLERNKSYTLEPVCLASDFHYHSSLKGFNLAVGNKEWVESQYEKGNISEEDIQYIREVYQTNDVNTEFLFRKKFKFTPCKTGIILRPQTPMWNGVFLRSGSSIKYGLGLHNNVGVIDYSYRGPSDELKLALYSRMGDSIPIKKGERVCQLIRFEETPCELNKLNPEALKEVEDKDRGSFGSTGNR